MISNKQVIGLLLMFIMVIAGTFYISLTDDHQMDPLPTWLELTTLAVWFFITAWLISQED